MCTRQREKSIAGSYRVSHRGGEKHRLAGRSTGFDHLLDLVQERLFQKPSKKNRVGLETNEGFWSFLYEDGSK